MVAAHAQAQAATKAKRRPRMAGQDRLVNVQQCHLVTRCIDLHMMVDGLNGNDAADERRHGQTSSVIATLTK